MKIMSYTALIVPCIIISLSIYNKYKENSENKKIKEYFESALIRGEKSTVESVVIDKSLLAVDINIPAIMLTKEEKILIANKSKRLLLERICNNNELLLFVESGYTISIDVKVNSKLRAIANLIVTKDSCPIH